MSEDAYTSSLVRLRRLPEVFTLKTLAGLEGMSVQQVSIYASRWKKAGLIEPFSARSGVFFNLLKDPRARQKHELGVLRSLFPSAVLIGASVLHDAGWTTQIPNDRDIAVLHKRSTPSIPGFTLHSRALGWYKKAHPYLENSSTGIISLRPEAALADAWLHDGLWRPDIDDLEMEDERTALIEKAFNDFECEIPEQYAHTNSYTNSYG